MFKKFCAVFLALAAVTLGGISALVFAVDPFSHYRVPDDYTQTIYQIPFYQNVGIAKHAKFDTLVTGSSMTQNFRANWFDEKFGCKAIRLSFDGGSIYDFDVLLDAALEGEKIKTVYFGIDNYNLTNETKNLTLDSKIPKYLYDDNIFNDVNYLLNKDVIFEYMRTYFSYKASDSYNFYEMHAWDNNKEYVYSKQAVLDSYDRGEICEELSPDSYSEFNSQATQILVKHVAANPQTKFVLFSPPYSIVYWDEINRSGKLDATLSALANTYNELLKYDNVEVYYFQNDPAIITDLDIYRDYSHYGTQVNKLMLDCFGDGRHRIMAGEVEKSMDEMKRIIKSYDFDNLFATEK